MRVKHAVATALSAGLLLAATTGPGSAAVIDRVVDAETVVILIEDVGRERHLPVSVLHPDLSPGTWLLLWPTSQPMVDNARTEQRRTSLRARQEALLVRSDPRRWTRDAGVP